VPSDAPAVEEEPKGEEIPQANDAAPEEASVRPSAEEASERPSEKEGAPEEAPPSQEEGKGGGDQVAAERTESQAGTGTSAGGDKADQAAKMRRARAVYGQQAEPHITRHSDKDGNVKFAAAEDIMKQLGVRYTDAWEDRAQTLAAQEGKLTSAELFALIGSFMPSVAPGKEPSLPNVQSSRTLGSNRRSYLDTGVLTADDAVLEFMRSLEQQRVRAEEEGRYKEAKECVRKLRELKTKEVERLQAEIQERHEEEWAEAERAFVRDQLQAEAAWEDKMAQFDEALAAQMSELEDRHDMQIEEIRLTASDRPGRQRRSKQLLNQREIERRLAKSGDYDKAIMVKRSADQLERLELEQGKEALEAELAMKEAKAVQKQQMEREALAQRGKRGRQELVAARKQDREKRERRYRNIRAELTNMQRLEIVQLENFLEQQALAGKRDLPPPAMRLGGTLRGEASRASLRASVSRTSLKAGKA